MLAGKAIRVSRQSERQDTSSCAYRYSALTGPAFPDRFHAGWPAIPAPSKRLHLNRISTSRRCCSQRCCSASSRVPGSSAPDNETAASPRADCQTSDPARQVSRRRLANNVHARPIGIAKEAIVELGITSSDGVKGSASANIATSFHVFQDADAASPDYPDKTCDRCPTARHLQAAGYSPEPAPALIDVHQLNGMAD